MYNFAIMDFGASAGATTHQIAGPSGLVGRLVEIGVTTTEAFLDDTLEAAVELGIIGDLDAHAKLNITDATAINVVFNSGDDTDAILDADIPADTALQLTLTEGTDGSGVTGQGQPYVIIDWF